MALLACVAFGTSTACNLEVSFEGSRYRCDDGSSSSCPSGFECVRSFCEKPSGVGPDAAPTPQSWIDDNVADFTGTSRETSVQARGALEPAAYYQGGVIERGYDSDVFDDGASATWEAVQAFAGSGATALARSADLYWDNGETPAGVALSDSNNFTLSFAGEVWLDAGVWTFFLWADDHAFLEVADPATGVYQRVTAADWPDEQQGDFTASASGWYPIRWAVSDLSGAAGVSLRFEGPGAGPYALIPPHRLRARVDQLEGLLETGFDDMLQLGDAESTIDATAPANADWGTGRPADLGLSSSDSFSVRWSGQLRIDVDGLYRFRDQSDDGQRLWIDGLPLLDAWDGSPHAQLTPVLALAPGWHDIVIDHTDGVGPSSVHLTVDSGPELAGAALPVERLRPAEGRGERYQSASNHSSIPIPDVASAQSTINLVAPADAKVNRVDVSFTFDHPYTSDLVMTLFAPNGVSTVLRDRLGGGNSVTGEVDRYTGSFLVGAPVAGTWKLRFADVASSDVGFIRDFQLTVHYAGGEPPIAPLAVYESPVRDLGQVFSIDRVAWQERRPAGTSVTVALRSCAAPADCASAAWSEPLVDPAGSVPTVTPQRFLQYRVELGSDGAQAAALESIQIDYVAAP